MSPPRKSTRLARRVLADLPRRDLAGLLARAKYEVRPIRARSFGGVGGKIVLFAPSLVTEAIMSLDVFDKRRVGEAIASCEFDAPTIFDPTDLICEVVQSNLTPRHALLAEMVSQRATMISAYTSRGRLPDLNLQYVARERRIRALADRLGVQYANPHPDLWDWHRLWRKMLRPYRERKEYVWALFREAIGTIVLPTAGERKQSPTDYRNSNTARE